MGGGKTHEEAGPRRLVCELPLSVGSSSTGALKHIWIFGLDVLDGVKMNERYEIIMQRRFVFVIPATWVRPL